MLGLRGADMEVPFCRTGGELLRAENPAAWRPSRPPHDWFEWSDDVAVAEPMTYVGQANDVTTSAECPPPAAAPLG